MPTAFFSWFSFTSWEVEKFRPHERASAPDPSSNAPAIIPPHSRENVAQESETLSGSGTHGAAAEHMAAVEVEDNRPNKGAGSGPGYVGTFIPLPREGSPSDRRLTVSLVGPSPTEGTKQIRFLHETGHVMSRILNLQHHLAALPASRRMTVQRELYAVMEKNTSAPEDWREDPEEWIGEMFKEYMLNPEETKRTAPLATAIIRKLWNEDERLSALIIFS